jgi:uncharacterized OB-fold protein
MEICPKCPKCGEQELRAGEDLCPRCRSDKTNFWVKLGEVAVGVVVTVISVIFLKRPPKV